MFNLKSPFALLLYTYGYFQRAVGYSLSNDLGLDKLASMHPVHVTLLHFNYQRKGKY